MTSIDDLRDAIAACRHAVQQEKQTQEQLDQNIREAEQRQQMRRELERVQADLKIHRYRSEIKRVRRESIDLDQSGPHMPEHDSLLPVPSSASHENLRGKAESVTDCSSVVADGELVWNLKGFSWLKTTLEQSGEEMACSGDIDVVGHIFGLVYCPYKGCVDRHEHRASLAIYHETAKQSVREGVAFRYRVSVKSKERGFVQWGSIGDVCIVDENTDHMAFGPDVCSMQETPAGIFGLGHEELLTSEWVIDDTLTARLHVEVRPQELALEKCVVDPFVEVPPANIGENLISLLDDTSCSDVIFIVQGEAIKAHSQILSARSEVLRRQLFCGMRESRSKEVVVEDCEPGIFKVLLRFVYSDSFGPVEELIEMQQGENSSRSAEGIDDQSRVQSQTARVSLLQKLLAVSHKYQLARLQLWCENELCRCINVEDVCSVLCQAHLYEAKQLEKACLHFAKGRMEAVVKTSSFGAMSREWPEVMLKFSLFIAGVAQTSTLAALVPQQNANKRKHVE